MSKKTFPRKPFKFGRYIIEYTEDTNSSTHFLKEVIDTEVQAELAAKQLKEQGYNNVVIKQIG
jgi:hypothetical protein